MKYHPRIGYTYMPCSKMCVNGRNGRYLVRTNLAGFRSEREFEEQSSPGQFQVLLFGDSQSAGEGISNTKRFSDNQ